MYVGLRFGEWDVGVRPLGFRIWDHSGLGLP